MSRKERVIAGLLLAVAVAGGALFPRLLSAPASHLGLAFAPGPGRSVVRIAAIPQPPRRTPSPLVAPPAEATATPFAPVAPITVPASKPSAVNAARHGHAAGQA